jgi:hypothetical protein
MNLRIKLLPLIVIGFIALFLGVTYNTTYVSASGNQTDAELIPSPQKKSFPASVDAPTADPVVSFASATSSRGENQGVYTISVVMDITSTLPINVNFSVSGTSTATGGGVDYSISSSPITIPAESLSANISLTPVNDSIDENNETVIITLDSATNGASIGSPNQHTATITDDDPTPTVSFTSASQSGSEGAGSMTVTAQLSAVSGLPISVPYSVSGTATGSGIDYTITASPLNIPAGSPSGNITITLVDDALDENDETVIVTMGIPTNATATGVTQHTATITDNDDQPTVSFTSASQSQSEAGLSMTVTAQLSAVSGLPISVPYSVSGTATGSGIDYTITASPLNILAGSPSGNITITLVDDALDENDETVIVTMGTPTNATATGVTQHTATITDNDGQPTVSFTSASQSLDEAGGSMTVTAQLSTTSGQDVIVPYTLAGTANGGGIDYSISPISPITITAGNLTTDIIITIVDDALPEGSETVVVTMGTPTNATATGVTQHTATITDNDGQPTVSFTSASQSLNEAGGSMTITAQLSTISGQNVTVPYTLGGTANGGGVDYSITPSPIIITAGLPSADITITIVDDSIIESNETVVVTMGTPTNATATGITQQTATITDNDLAGIIVHPTVGESLLTSENGITATFTVTLTSQPIADVVLSMASSNTKEGIVTSSPNPLTFNNSNWSTPQLVTVTGLDDHKVDGPIDYTINLTASSTDTNFNNVTASVPATNADNDVAGLAVSPTSGLKTGEGGQSKKINIFLNTQPSSNVTIAVSSSKPSEGDVSPASLTFTPLTWDSAQTVTVTGVDDFVADGDVLYYVIISATSTDNNYNGKQSTIPITNQDAPTIEWVLPVGNEGIYYFTSDSDPITLKVQPVGDEPIESVYFYRWDHVLLTRVDIKTDTNPPYQTTLDPKSLYFEFNQIFAVAYSPDNVASINVRVLPFRKYALFLPIVYRNSKLPSPTP